MCTHESLDKKRFFVKTSVDNIWGSEARTASSVGTEGKKNFKGFEGIRPLTTYEEEKKNRTRDISSFREDEFYDWRRPEGTKSPTRCE
jgi:hypothetical protein